MLWSVRDEEASDRGGLLQGAGYKLQVSGGKKHSEVSERVTGFNAADS
jgi:hypothetical protein